MQRAVICAFLVLLVAVGGAQAADNERPLADAGLDQHVENGTTVYLDAGGSRDPDGDIVAYSWSVQAPDGDTVATDCPDCERTHFRPNRTGRYSVTLIVRDDDGGTRSDTLYVTVERRGSPSVTLSGPESVDKGSNATFEANVTSGDAPLASVVWIVDDSVAERQAVAGRNATVNHTVTTSNGDSRRIVATAWDIEGQNGSAVDTLKVRRHTGGSTRQVCGFEKGLRGGGENTFGSCDTSDKLYDMGDTKIYHDINGDGQITFGGEKIGEGSKLEIDMSHKKPDRSGNNQLDVLNYNSGSQSSTTSSDNQDSLSERSEGKTRNQGQSGGSSGDNAGVEQSNDDFSYPPRSVKASSGR